MNVILNGIEPYWIWFGVACLLLAIEVLIVPTGFFLCLGTSAVLMAVLVFFVPSLSWLWMVSIYSALIVCSCLFWMKVIRGRPKEADSDRLSRRADQLVGSILVLDQHIKNGRGRVKIQDSPWPVEAAEDYPAGTRVEVTRITGITLTVVRAEQGGRTDTE